MLQLEGSRILITGGAGCIGSYVAELMLQDRVAEIVILDDFSKGSKENLQEAMASNRVKVLEGNILDPALLNQACEGIDYCFHLAAIKIIQCAAEPRKALDINCIGTFNVLEACVAHQVKKIVLASTASVYGQADTFPIHESHHPYNNHTLYGASKMANELMCRSFFAMYGFQYNAMRYFNVYGPRMDASGKYTEVLIRWYHLIKQGKSPVIYGNGEQTMDFVFVKDVARATALTLKTDAANEIFNCGTGVETSLKQLCLMLLEAMESDLKPQHIPVPQERMKLEVYRRRADVSRARALIGFEAEVTLKTGLNDLVKWLDQNPVLLQVS